MTQPCDCPIDLAWWRGADVAIAPVGTRITCEDCGQPWVAQQGQAGENSRRWVRAGRVSA